MTIHDYRKWVPKQAADKRWAQTGHERWEPQELKLVPQEEGKHVALDWYNTVYQNGWVPPENLEGLKLLQDHGFTLLSFEWGSVIRRRQRWVASWNGYRPTRLASSSMMTGSSWKSAGTMGFGCMQCAQTPKRSSSPVYSEQAYSGPQPLIFIQKFVGLSMKRALPLLGPPRPFIVYQSGLRACGMSDSSPS